MTWIFLLKEKKTFPYFSSSEIIAAASEHRLCVLPTEATILPSLCIQETNYAHVQHKAQMPTCRTRNISCSVISESTGCQEEYWATRWSNSTKSEPVKWNTGCQLGQGLISRRRKMLISTALAKLRPPRYTHSFSFSYSVYSQLGPRRKTKTPFLKYFLFL